MISILLLFVISCNSPNETKEKNNCMEITGKDTIWKRHTIKNDAFYQFLPITDSTYKVEWGNRVFNNVSNEVFETSGSGIFQLLDHNEMAIILEKSCGTSCNSYLVLPFHSQAKEKVFLFAIAYNMENNLVAYISENDQVFVSVENYLTRKKTDIKIESLCPAAFKGDCIDTSYFINNKYIIRWHGCNWSDSNQDILQKEIFINL